jgi:hypothetical protein
MSSKDYFRPRGDITTVLDLADRDSQDNTYFPIDSEGSWFHRKDHDTAHPTAMSVQEFTQRGPADWGQTMSFEIGSLPAGDLLQGLILQIRVGHWYNETIVKQLLGSQITTNLASNPQQYWTFINSLGSSIIEHADFIVKDQTIERITGEFISTHLKLMMDQNQLFGVSVDGNGSTPYTYLAPPGVLETAFHPRRPYPIEDGIYQCALPFFFLRTVLKEVFPLLSCNEGQVRVDIKLRPFDQVVRNYLGYRATCTDVPLNKQTSFVTTTNPVTTVTTTTASCAPPFRDFRIITCCALVTGSLRNQFLRKPFEQMVKLTQLFHFEEPLKYLVSKPNPNSDTVEIQLPLELNHPVVEIIWVFRRKAVRVNNEWSNFTPSIGLEAKPQRITPPWLQWATLRVNGSEVVSAEGDWFREQIAQQHRGGITAYSSYVYGFSFAKYPDDHQPSGTANMSRSTSVTLRLTVNQPIQVDLTTLNPPCNFDPAVVGGWEVFVYAMHYNWLRFENGICNRVFTD